MESKIPLVFMEIFDIAWKKISRQKIPPENIVAIKTIDIMGSTDQPSTMSVDSA